MNAARMSNALVFLGFAASFATSLAKEADPGTCVACQMTQANGGLATAIGYQTVASGNVAFAVGFNTTAGGNSSVAMGVSTRTVSDPNVPGGSSCGGCVATGLMTTTIGDWSTASGEETTARGYTSSAMGYGTVAHTFGETALGLYTELSGHTEEELRNQSVIPTFDEGDAVLRVGIGCPENLPAGGFGCKRPGRLDALRVYKSGALYLKKPDGSVVPDVQAALEKCAAENEDTKEELMKVKHELSEMKTALAALMARFAKLEAPLQI